MKVKLKGGKVAELRPLRGNDDVFALAEYINALVDERTYLAIDKKVAPEEEAAWLQRQAKSMQEGVLMDWRLWLGGKCIGGMEARRGRWKERGNVEFGIALAKGARGQGIGTKMLKMAISEVRKKWRPKNMYICVYSGNCGAHELYKSLGFKEFARFPNWVSHYGKYGDKIWLRLGARK